MALNFFEIDFSEFGKHLYLRNDVKYWHTINSLATFNSIKLKNIFDFLNGKSYTDFYSKEKTNIPYVRIGDLTYRYSIDENNIIYLDENVEIPKEKILQKDDLILAVIGNTVGKINLVKKLEGGTFSNNTILLRLKNKNNFNPLFLEKLFQSPSMQRYIWGVVSQKAQPNLQTYDLKEIKIPLIPKHIQDQAVARIEPIEQEIKQLKSQIKDPQEIINRVFAREFGFDLEKFEESKKEKFFEVDFSEINKIEDLRCSVKFFKKGLKILNVENVDFKPIRFFLKKNNCKNIKKGKLDRIYNLIELADVDNNNGKILNINEVDNIGSDKLHFNDADILTAKLRPYLGKTILNTFNNFTIGTTEWIPLKLNNKIKKEYLFYILLSGFYCDFVKDFMSGKQHPRIKPSLLYSFQIPNIPLSQQQKIVDEIKNELARQEEIKKQIEEKRNEIDKIIEEVIKP